MSKKEKGRDSILPPPTKVVIRHLPPEFTEEDFKKCCWALCVDQMGLSKGTSGFELLQFCPGKYSQRKGRIPGVGYVMLHSLEAAKKFIALVATSEVFQAPGKGSPEAQMYAVHALEAPCQKLPVSLKRGLRKDNRVGTHKKDPMFKKFMEQLETPVEKLPSAEVQLDQKLAAAENVEPTVPTLVEYLKKRRENREKQRLQRKEEAAAKKTRKERRKSAIEKEKDKVKDKKNRGRRSSGKERDSGSAEGGKGPRAGKEEEKRRQQQKAAAKAAAENERKSREARKAATAARSSGSGTSSKQQVKILSKALSSAAGGGPSANPKPVQLLARAEGHKNSPRKQAINNLPPHPQQNPTRPPSSGSNKRSHPSNPPKEQHSQQQYIPKGGHSSNTGTGGQSNTNANSGHGRGAVGGGRGFSIMQRQASGRGAGGGQTKTVGSHEQHNQRGRGSGRGGNGDQRNNNGHMSGRGKSVNSNRGGYHSKTRQEYRRKTDAA